MKVATSTVTIRPALPLPAPPAAEQPAPLELPTTMPGLGAPVIDSGVVEQCGEGIAALLDAYGDGKSWPYACAGSAVGVILGGLNVVEAHKRGDAAGMRAGLVKIGLGGLGVIGSGLCAGHPAIHNGVEAIRQVLGAAAAPPPPVIGYTLGLARRPGMAG